uniref:Putative conserved plasma membrane protein n=1 Tax=Amblyomma tuberculatum TaxID=48802 RepID=A0A6M2E1J4_9ACAR
MCSATVLLIIPLSFFLSFSDSFFIVLSSLLPFPFSFILPSSFLPFLLCFPFLSCFPYLLSSSLSFFHSHSFLISFPLSFQISHGASAPVRVLDPGDHGST